MKMNSPLEILKGDMNNGYLQDNGCNAIAFRIFKFIVRWPVVAKKDLSNDRDYCVNIRKEEFSSYEEAKRHKNFLISHLNDIRSTIPPSEIIIEILEC